LVKNTSEFNYPVGRNTRRNKLLHSLQPYELRLAVGVWHQARA